MKIVSLLPAATEMVCLLGLQKSLVGISDDSDYPTSVTRLPKVTTATINNTFSSLEIDKQVKEAKHRGLSVFHIDKSLLATLAPDLILTQELCPVCAVAYTDIEKAARNILKDTKIISLEPHTIAGIFKNITTIAKYVSDIKQNVIPDSDRGSRLDSRVLASRRSGRGNDKSNVYKRAQKVIKSLKSRLLAVSEKVKGTHKPSVLIIEWLDPIMIAGHWVPEMVEKAGGKMLIAKKKEKSQYLDWSEVVRINPDIILIAPCGFSIKRTREEISLITKRKEYKTLKAFKNKKIFLVDGNAYLTRPGPRIIDGVEILAEIFHPDIFSKKYSAKDWQKITS